MCGIFGHYIFHGEITRQQILDIMFCGLHRLEYRGYDSAGISIESEPVVLEAGINGKKRVPAPAPIIIKSKGNIPALEALATSEIEQRPIDVEVVFNSHIAISHTRWATHGEPSARNSHPISSGPSAEFTVVHNGIITNFARLRAFLEEEGATFDTDTDTEVIPKLCALLHTSLEGPVPFSQLVMDVLRKLEGAYAILVQSVHYPGELVCCRKGSPVVFGLKDHKGARGRRFRQTTDLDGECFGEQTLECFIASDDKAIIEHTRAAIPLQDGDVLHIKGAGWGIFNIDADDGETAVPRVMQKLEGKLESILKGSFDHYMQKEIFEQPESLGATMLGRVKRVATSGDPYLHPRITLGGLEQKIATIARSRRMILIACGTSFHSCLAMRPLLESFGEMPVELELASDFTDRRAPVYRDDTVICCSQSGETADTLVALRYAKSCGALCIGITNTVGSSLSRETECGVHLNAGYEMGVASTKAYTSLLVVLVMIAVLLAKDSISKRVQRDRIADELLRLPELVRLTLKLDGRIQELAKQLQNEPSLLVFGRGHNYATALEAALKIKEIALVHGEGVLAGELKHGPLALIDAQLPLIVIATRDSMYHKMLSVIQQLKARMARLIVICNEGDTEVPELLSQGSVASEEHEKTWPGEVLFVPETVESLQPVVNVIPLQLLSYHLTLLRGFNVDQPRNLAKSVTVTED